MSSKGLGELGRLTAGEKLLIDRRRNGRTQADAARHYDVGRFRYGLWERDKQVGGVPNVIVRSARLDPWERCLIYRHRSGKTQEEIAKGLKMSRYWINKMERGEEPCDSLLWYWEQ